MTISKLRSFLYGVARFLGDVSAVKRGTVGQRIERRIFGKAVGRGMGRWFK